MLRRILTPRLELLCLDRATTARVLADPTRGELSLGKAVPASWRASGFKDFLPAYLRQRLSDAADDGWGLWVIVLRATDEIIGDVGFGSAPDERGELEIAFMVVPEQRHRGYATEAIAALAAWALEHDEVAGLRAVTDADNAISAAVLQHVGFTESEADGQRVLWRLRRRPPTHGTGVTDASKVTQ